MRFGWLVLAGMLAGPMVARADVYDFLYVQSDQSAGCDPSEAGCLREVIEFQLTSPVKPDAYTATQFSVYDVDFLQHPINGAGNAIQFGQESDGDGPYGISIYDPATATTEPEAYLYFQNFNQSFFTGSTSSPSLFATSGAANVFEPGCQGDDPTCGPVGGGTGFLTITDLSTAATPEPSSLALLGTGVLGAVGAVRRRLGRG